MSDTTTNPARLLSPQPGDRFDLDHGTIRIDEVTDEQVYFVRWKGAAQHGDPIRMPVDVYREVVRRYLTRNEEP